MKLWLLIAAAAVILILAGIAAYYLWQLAQVKRRQAEQLEKLEAENRAQRERVNKSIQIIADAVQKDDVTLTEASIRIAFLLDSLEVEEEVQAQYSAFYQLREATAHIPFLDAWKKLSRKEQFQYDKERLGHEETYRDFVLDAARRIRGQWF